MTLFPCPGRRACPQPRSTASSTASPPTSGVSSRPPTRSSNRRSSAASVRVRGSPPEGTATAPVGLALPGPGLHGEPADVQRGGEQVDRVGAQLVGAALAGDRGAGQRDPVADDRHLAPADPVGEVPVGDLEDSRRRQVGVRADRTGQPQGRQPARTRDGDHRGSLRLPGQPLAVHGGDDRVGELRALVGGGPRQLVGRRCTSRGDDLQLLGGRDLCPVHHRGERHLLRGQREGVRVVDGEVAQRVGLGRAGRAERPQRTPGQRDGSGPAEPHGGPPNPSSNACARGASSGEKCGVVSSTPASVSRAWSVIPRAASMAPRWYRRSGTGPAERGGLLGQGQRLGVPAGGVQGPGERVLAVDVLPAVVLGLGGGEGGRRVAVVGGEQGCGQVVGDAAGGEQLADGVDHGELVGCLVVPAQGLQVLAELDQVLRQRPGGDDGPVARHRGVVLPQRGVDPGAAEHQGRVVRAVQQPGGELRTGLVQVALVECELAQVDAAEGLPGRVGREVQGLLQRRPGLVGVPVQLGVVGGAGERCESRAQLEHPVQRLGRAGVVAELGAGVDQHAVRRRAEGVDDEGGLGGVPGRGEVVTGIGQRPLAGQRRVVAVGVQHQRLRQRPLGLVVVAGLGGDAGLLHVRRTELRPGRPVPGHGGQPLLGGVDGGGQRVDDGGLLGGLRRCVVLARGGEAGHRPHQQQAAGDGAGDRGAAAHVRRWAGRRRARWPRRRCGRRSPPGSAPGPGWPAPRGCPRRTGLPGRRCRCR